MKRIRKNAIAILITSAALLLTSCQSTEYRGATMNNLDLTVGRDDFEIIPEDEYLETMKNIVEPTLDEIRYQGTMESNMDRHRIYYEFYDVENEKGTIVLFHGFTEFIEKYNEIIYYFTRNGWDVYMPEHYGHGWSGRSEETKENLSKVVVEEFDIYVNDGFQLVDEVVNRNRDRNKPLVIYGHSMGGGISTALLETFPGHFDAAILSSPMLEVNTGGTPEWLAKFFAGSAKFFGAGENYVFGHGDFTTENFFGTDDCPATSYPRYQYGFEKRLEDEYKQMNGATWYWLDSALEATERITSKENAEKVVIPVLLFQAENDTLVKPEGQLKFASFAKNVNVVFAENAKHEIFNSPDDIAYAYWVTIFDFLDQVL